MKNKIRALTGRLTSLDPVYYYILPAVIFVFLYAAFGSFGSYPFKHMLVIPCILFLHTACSHPVMPATKKAIRLALAMVAWFTFLQLKRTAESSIVYDFGPIFCTYLFAFPLAFLMQDGEKKNCLKLFSAALLAASLCLSMAAVLLLLDRMPEFLTSRVFWDGARLNVFWHPNMAACLLMCGIAACLGFLHDAKKPWAKFALAVLLLILLAALALTSCRTVILLVGGLVGGTLFFSLVKGRWKRILPGLVLVCALIFLVYSGSRLLYDFHHDALLAKYTVQYQEQTQKDDSTKEAPPIRVNEATGQVSLQSESGQHALSKDIGSFNNRTTIWKAAFHAFRDSRSIQLFGIFHPGQYITYYNAFEVAHAHNAWVEALLGLGLPGFAIVMIFTLMAAWNSLVILLKHSGDVWKRVTALLTLCLMVASLMEPYLFLPPEDYYIFNFVFFLCVGYLAHWQEEDNRRILQAVRKFLHLS